MLIRLKNKDTLKIDEFSFKCCIGKKGLKIKKVEGDLATPKGTFLLKKLYYRSDKFEKIETLLHDMAESCISRDEGCKGSRTKRSAKSSFFQSHQQSLVRLHLLLQLQ